MIVYELVLIHAVHINNILLAYSWGPSTSSLSFFIWFSRARRTLAFIYIEAHTYLHNKCSEVYAYIQRLNSVFGRAHSGSLRRLTQTRSRTEYRTEITIINEQHHIYMETSGNNNNNIELWRAIYTTSRSVVCFFFSSAVLSLSSLFVHLSFPSPYI